MHVITCNVNKADIVITRSDRNVFFIQIIITRNVQDALLWVTK